jgi:hypothetical protein
MLQKSGRKGEKRKRYYATAYFSIASIELMASISMGIYCTFYTSFVLSHLNKIQRSAALPAGLLHK